MAEGVGCRSDLDQAAGLADRFEAYQGADSRAVVFPTAKGGKIMQAQQKAG